MRVFFYWTYSRPDDSLPADKVAEHERKKPKVENEKYIIGGLGKKSATFTHYLDRKGFFHILNAEASEMHIALCGGVNGEYCYVNNPSYDQLQTLGNLLRLFEFLNFEVREGDMLNFDLTFYKRALNLSKQI
jgi:hypothetical protein